MFIGQYEHRLEEKGRLSIPKKFRSELGGGTVLSQGLDGCLFLYPKSSWEQLINKLSQLPLTKRDTRSFTRVLSYAASEVEFDGIGRILIPDYLRQFAGLVDACVVAGAIDRVEIWSQAKFKIYSAKVNQHAEDIAEKLELS
ncbi:MAG: division/cell wall cluster transcriptional repressor MraZ [bacterium]|nr:division/cell wall cluster transcriptional repressor MraZ [bacterium]